MATTADFKNGMCLEIDNELYQILEFLHKKPGKGAAFVRTKLKNVHDGRVFEKTFSAGEKVTTARVEERPFQFLYSDDTGYHFMNEENFEQVTLEEDMIDNPAMLKEGLSVTIVYHDESETPIKVKLPQFIDAEITYTEPGVKGDTATNTLKPATIETGASVQVPLFIETGEQIKVDTRNNTYVERVKNK